MLKFSSSNVRRRDLSLTEQHFQIQTSCCTCCPPHCWHMITFCHSWLRLHTQSNLAVGHIMVEVSFRLSCLCGPLMLHKTMNKPWINPINKPNNRLFLLSCSQDSSLQLSSNTVICLWQRKMITCVFSERACQATCVLAIIVFIRCCLNLTLHRC